VVQYANSRAIVIAIDAFWIRGEVIMSTPSKDHIAVLVAFSSLKAERVLIATGRTGELRGRQYLPFATYYPAIDPSAAAVLAQELYFTAAIRLHLIKPLGMYRVHLQEETQIWHLCLCRVVDGQVKHGVELYHWHELSAIEQLSIDPPMRQAIVDALAFIQKPKQVSREFEMESKVMAQLNATQLSAADVPLGS
jgi:hypothetical protein